MIILVVMDFIIFICYEINVNNTRKCIVIFMAYLMLIKDRKMLKINIKKVNYFLQVSLTSSLCQQQLFFYNMLAQTIKKNMYAPYDVLEIMFGVTIYQKWKMFGFLIFSRFPLLFFSESNCL